MTLKEKKVSKFNEALKTFTWFKNEMLQYVKDGDLTPEQANLLIEDMAEQLNI